MDACMVDASEVPDIEIGDIAECINGEFSGQISVESFAAEHKTISYEITTRMARRLYRLYRYKGKTCGWNDLKKEFA
jgi:alanine racemase